MRVSENPTGADGHRRRHQITKKFHARRNAPQRTGIFHRSRKHYELPSKGVAADNVHYLHIILLTTAFGYLECATFAEFPKSFRCRCRLFRWRTSASHRFPQRTVFQKEHDCYRRQQDEEGEEEYARY